MGARPEQLSSADFSQYPPEARQRAIDRLPLLRRLPLSFLPLLLRELIVFDFKFPAERRELDRQFVFLAGISAAELSRAMAAFSQLRLSPELERTDWVNSPAPFSEQLTAHLWATHQIDSFRNAAVSYMGQVNVSVSSEPPPTRRLGIVVFGPGLSQSADFALFKKLRAHGSLFTHVDHEDGLELLLDAVAKRASSFPSPYEHWCIDGGAGLDIHQKSVVCVSYGALSAVRAALHTRMQKTYENGAFDPEAFRSMLARTQPQDLGLDAALDPILSRFELSILTEGSGTQVFSTTFVQWTAREALRRAQPLTLFARFTPRQRERPMNELLAESVRTPELDSTGSLIDADLGAYYTWMNQQRLSGAEDAAFLVWFQNQVMIVGPSIDRGKRIDSAVRLQDLIKRIT